MSDDESKKPDTDGGTAAPQDRTRPEWAAGWENMSREERTQNVLARLFPGPTPKDTPEWTARLQGLAEAAERRAAAHEHRQAQVRRDPGRHDQNRHDQNVRATSPKRPSAGVPARPSLSPATPPETPAEETTAAEAPAAESVEQVETDLADQTAEMSSDIEKLIDALHEQTEVIQAMLETNVSIRDDGRTTAQNSRTFAIAGTVIALFTLVAAVVTIFIAVNQ